MTHGRELRCERREAAQPSLPPPSKLAADAIDSGLLAAAEPFKTLARTASRRGSR